MKTNKFFLSLATLMVCATSVFISCSNDDDDNNNSKELGDKAVTELKTRLIDEDGAVVFGELNEQGCYEIGMETQSDAQDLVANYVKNASYTGNATLGTLKEGPYTLPDGRGTVYVENGQEDGVFYLVRFDVKGIPAMKLLIEEENYMDNENAYSTFIKYKCNESNCGIKFKLHNLAEKVCPKCGSTDITEQK